MAKLNGMYLFVTDEDYSFGAEVTEHAVEEGIAISDHVKRKANILSISGEIVGEDADSIRSKLDTMLKSGTVCNYSGRCSMSKCLITEFSTSHPHTIWGGCSFSMTLKEVRTATTSYKPTNKENNAGTQQPVKESAETYVYHTVKKGDCVWNLVAKPGAPYKKYGLDCQEVMRANPDAFSRKGDFRTLQIGEKLIVGVRATGTVRTIGIKE